MGSGIAALRWSLVSGLLSALGCSDPTVGSLCSAPNGATAAETIALFQDCLGVARTDWSVTRHTTTLDVLFVIDNSPGMAAKQRLFAEKISAFISAIERPFVDLHLGVISTDLGAQQTPYTPFQPGSRNVTGCASYRGDDGDLQGKSCGERDQSAWSADAQAACRDLCPTALTPTDGARYLWKNKQSSNIPGGDLAGAFRCLTLIGDSGCELESPLEAAKRALDNHSLANSGFLRQGSQLAVVFVTDEDDCSVAMTARGQNNPQSLDCSGMSGVPNYNCWNNDFRCFGHNLRCNEPLTSSGVKSDCQESGNGYLESVDKYIRFFGNMRPSTKLHLSGVWSPSMLDNPQSDPSKPGGVSITYDEALCIPGAGMSCPSNTLNRKRGVHTACQDSTDQRMYGLPQLRLSKFLRAFDPNFREEVSICEPTKWQDALGWISHGFPSYVDRGPSCLSAKPRSDALGTPLCIAGFVDRSTPYALPPTLLPRCSPACCNAWSIAGTSAAPFSHSDPLDPVISTACMSDPDCFCAVSYEQCFDDLGNPTGLFGVWVKEPPHETPNNQLASIRCVTELR